MKKLFGLFALVAVLVATASATPMKFTSGTKQVSLLELYSSEGCRSCPPAEAWLNKLKDAPDLWKNFAPLAFHVDYWDSLGWKDRWSSPAFSERQRDYAKLWRSENIYTPEFVLNGQEWRNWFGRRGAPSSSANVGVLEINSTSTNRWSALHARRRDEWQLRNPRRTAGGRLEFRSESGRKSRAGVAA